MLSVNVYWIGHRYRLILFPNVSYWNNWLIWLLLQHYYVQSILSWCVLFRESLVCARELTSCWSVARIAARAACFDVCNRIWGLVRERAEQEQPCHRSRFVN